MPKKDLALSALTLESWCPARDSNPHASRRQDLNLLRLPIPPAGPFVRYSGSRTGNEETRPPLPGERWPDSSPAMTRAAPLASGSPGLARRRRRSAHGFPPAGMTGGAKRPMPVSGPLEQEVQPRLDHQAISLAREQARQIALPLAAAVLDDEKRWMEIGRRIPEERLKDDVFGALDIELDGVDVRKPFVPDQVE